MQLRILSHQRDCHLVHRVIHVVDHLHPLPQIRLRAGKLQAVAHRLREMLVLHHQRNLIDGVGIEILQHVGTRHVAEQGNLVLQLLRHLIFGAADNDVRPDTHALQLTHRRLRGLCLHFAGTVKIRDQRDMNHARVIRADLLHELTDRLIEGLGFDVADRAAHLDDGDPFLLLARRAVEPTLDLVRDMWNHLNRAAAVIAVALLVQNRPVHLSAGDIGIMVQALVDEALIMSEVQIRLRAVVRDKHLAVLNRVHRAGIHIQIGIELLHRDAVAARLQQTPERGRCDALAKS